MFSNLGGKKNVCISENTSSNCNRSKSIFTDALRSHSQLQKKQAHALSDCASQSRYVIEKLINKFHLPLFRNETVMHTLFREDETKPNKHNVFDRSLCLLKEMYTAIFEVLSKRKEKKYPKYADRKN